MLLYPLYPVPWNAYRRRPIHRDYDVIMKEKW